MSKSRPPIKDPMKREVRQRCGFGCVICGLPIYEYEHIVDYAIVKRHETHNITLLCPNHHSEKTKGLRSRESIIAADKAPYNIINQTSTPYKLGFSGTEMQFIIGDCVIQLDNINPHQDQLIPFLVNEKKLISFEIIDGQLFLNLVVFDDNGNLLLKIIENEMVFYIPQWDITFVGKNLTLREGTRKIVFDIQFNIPDTVTISRGQWNYEGYEIIIKPDRVNINKATFQLGSLTNYRIIYCMGKYTKKDTTAFLFQPLP